MDVKTFVSETLTQIVQGVSDARKQIAAMEVGARVNPTELVQGAKNRIAEASEVKFDLAVTVSSETEDGTSKKGGAKASAGLITIARGSVQGEIGAASSNKERNEAISRVQFSVKLSQPADIYEHVRPAHTPIPASKSGWMA